MRTRVIMAATAVFALFGFSYIDAIFAGTSAAQTGPTSFQPGPGGAPLSPSSDVCWSELPDLEGYLLSSEIIGEFGLESEIANDFVFPEDRTIQKIRWWGGYYNTNVACDPGMVAPEFNIRFYRGDGCITDPPYHGAPFAEVVVEGTAGERLIGCLQDLYPVYQYESVVDLHAAGGTTYWVGIQMASHEYPPQWGRLLVPTITRCESLWWTNAYFDWEWYQLSEVVGLPLDASQEFECDMPVAVQQSSWGAVRALYR